MVYNSVGVVNFSLSKHGNFEIELYRDKYEIYNP